jgi:sugar phosphate permease
MDTDKFRNFIAIGLILYACVNVLMKLMPNIATQLPLPVYEFFYSITLNIEPSPPTETFSQEVEPNSS